MKVLSSRAMIVFLLLLGVGEGASAEGNPESIKVGVIAGLTGDYAPVFENWVKGIELAKELHNQSEKFPKVTLMIEDDEFDPKKGLSAFRKLVDVNEVVALMNGSSSTIGAIAPLINRLRLPVIQLGEEAEQPTADSIFQIMPGNIAIERALGQVISKKYGENPLIVYTVHPTMLRFVEAFEDGLGKSAMRIELDPSETNLQPIALQAMRRTPSCIVILCFPSQGALLTQAFRDLQSTAPLVFDGNFQSGLEDYKRILGNLDFLTESLLAYLKLHTSEEFKELYSERFGERPPTMADLGYDAFSVLLSSYKRNNGEWIQQIAIFNGENASGRISFDEFGVREPRFKIGTVGDFLESQ